LGFRDLELNNKISPARYGKQFSPYQRIFVHFEMSDNNDTLPLTIVGMNVRMTEKRRQLTFQ